MNKKIGKMIVTMFGVGHIKYFPGTFASLITASIYYIFYTIKIDYFLLILINLFLFIYSVLMINNLEGECHPESYVLLTSYIKAIRNDYVVNEFWDRIILDEKKCSYLFQENNNFVFMDLETYEQLEVSSEIIGDQIHFLSDGMEVLVNSYESQVISIDLPETCEVEVIEADAVIKGQTVSSSYKPATIKNGIKIMVPGHIEVGTKIIIKPADGTYVEKSKL